MRKDAKKVEESRLQGIERIEDYPSFHERHRLFPEIFGPHRHERILDIAAGVGCAARRIHDMYDGKIICNDITATCLQILKNQGLDVVSFDIDDGTTFFPFDDGTFDAIVSLATIEHVLMLDHHFDEIQRIVKDGGYLYISTPNYAALVHLIRYLFRGESFHDPLNKDSRYEFYAHVRYFTYKTLIEFISSFGFTPLAVYLPLPNSSSYYKSMKTRNPVRAFLFHTFMWFLYKVGSPRWASEPVLVFQKTEQKFPKRIQKIVV